MRGWTVVALATLLAGCMDGAPTGDEGAIEPEGGFLEAEADEGLGAITGVVVDQSIRPIEGATVVLLATNATMVTDAQGRFAFDKLEPGAYFIGVSAARHLPTQTSTTVEPGQTATLRVSLAFDDSPEPYHQTHHFNGMIHFHATWAWATVEWVLDSEHGITTPACECVYAFESDIQPQGHVYEAVWEDSIEHPSGPQELYWEYAVPDPFQEVYGYAASPIYQRWDTQPWETETGEYKAILMGPAEWVAIEQTFEIFLTQWFNGVAPEGWSVVERST